jgi:hypothetical protein
MVTEQQAHQREHCGQFKQPAPERMRPLPHFLASVHGVLMPTNQFRSTYA